MLKKILVALVAIVLLVVLSGFLLPTTWNVERSVTIDSGPERIYPLVSDLRRWPQWVAWTRESDPTLTHTFGGAPQGDGAVMEWRSDRMGRGQLTITESHPEKGVKYRLLVEDRQLESHGSIEFAADGKGTRVTWRDAGDLGFGPIARYLGIMIDPALGPDLQRGLDELKRQVEGAETGADRETTPGEG